MRILYSKLDDNISYLDTKFGNLTRKSAVVGNFYMVVSSLNITVFGTSK